MKCLLFCKNLVDALRENPVVALFFLFCFLSLISYKQRRQKHPTQRLSASTPTHPPRTTSCSPRPLSSFQPITHTRTERNSNDSVSPSPSLYCLLPTHLALLWNVFNGQIMKHGPSMWDMYKGQAPSERGRRLLMLEHKGATMCGRHRDVRSDSLLPRLMETWYLIKKMYWISLRLLHETLTVLFVSTGSPATQPAHKHPWWQSGCCSLLPHWVDGSHLEEELHVLVMVSVGFQPETFNV